MSLTVVRASNEPLVVAKAFGSNSITLAIKDEDHTLGNALRATLNHHKDVEFAGYTMPHPTLPEMNVRIQTLGGRPAVEVLREALDTMGDVLTHIGSAFESAMEMK